MPLDPTQKQLVESWFKKKRPNHVCPACGNRSWQTVDAVGLDVVQPVGMGVNKVSTGSSHTSVIRMCDHCAYLAHFLYGGIMTGIGSATP
jgi:hypothetical protein